MPLSRCPATGLTEARPILSLADVRYARGGAALLDIPALTLSGGAPSVIMGPNGAGKSLMLRLMHGLIAPDRGRVDWADHQAAQAQAMVFQRPVLLRRSVAANIDYALKVCGVARAERSARIAEMLARGGLSGLASRPARSLSGGEQQRLAVIRALATGPRVLFMDEATANLDPAATQAIEGLVRLAAAEGTKIVMITHDPGQARRLAGEVIFLHRGSLAEQTPAEAFFDAPRSAAARAYLAGELYV